MVKPNTARSIDVGAVTETNIQASGPVLVSKQLHTNNATVTTRPNPPGCPTHVSRLLENFLLPSLCGHHTLPSHRRVATSAERLVATQTRDVPSDEEPDAQKKQRPEPKGALIAVIRQPNDCVAPCRAPWERKQDGRSAHHDQHQHSHCPAIIVVCSHLEPVSPSHAT